MKNLMENIVKNRLTIFIILFILLTDQILKCLVVFYLDPYGSIEIIKDFFYIQIVKNSGLAFGIGSTWFDLETRKIVFIILMLIALIILIRFARQISKDNLLEKIAFAFILGGALSNLTDKLIGDILYYGNFKLLYGKVIDYISFQYGNYILPTFNIADLAITTGLILLLFAAKNENNKTNLIEK